jgi:hypothetical protein
MKYLAANVVRLEKRRSRLANAAEIRPFPQKRRQTLEKSTIGSTVFISHRNKIGMWRIIHASSRAV